MRLFCCLVAASAVFAAEGQMSTRWTSQVSKTLPLPEYPRPQMVRAQWQNLNGPWDYSITPKDATRAAAAPAGKILVPFALESALSGVKRPLQAGEKLWYKRSFTVPAAWQGRRVMLHFGAVDWHAAVSVNGSLVGEHKGGYTPFSFDITKALKPGANEMTVAVTDPTDTWTQARGKQVSNPQGIWYTSVSGIWQTVWLEPVAAATIGRLKITPDVDKSEVVVGAAVEGVADGVTDGVTVQAVATENGREVARAAARAGEELRLKLANPKLWWPESPALYDLKVTLLRRGRPVDEVTSYFAVRKSSLGQDGQGRVRMMLNNRPYFQLGLLDQGWWPDGLYTAPTEEALKYDIEVTKRLGFNMARKHVKVEPARWYYWCDKLGLAVWQDMPNGHMPGRTPQSLFVAPEAAEDARRPADSAAQWEREWKEIIEHLHFFPSILTWVPFNEGWGQYDTARIAAWTKQLDPTRLVNAPSGWTDRGVGDLYDTHMYPGPGWENAGPNRATVLGEFGGLGWPVENHLWWTTKRNWGYRTYFSREELGQRYQAILNNVRGLLGFGLSAAIYTQTTDVEGEVNGMMTYDREIVKFDEAALKQIHAPLFRDGGKARWLMETGEEQRQHWLSRLAAPAEGWATGTDDAGWTSAMAPFGKDLFMPTGTPWDGGKLWLRRSFQLDRLPKDLWLAWFNDVGAGKLYLNGHLIATLSPDSRTSRHWGHVDLTPFAHHLLRGQNVVALEVEGAEKAAAIDVGFYTLD